MIKRFALLIVMTAVVASSPIYPLAAAEKDIRFTTAVELVELTYNREAVYQQFMYFGILPAKERWENNPKTKQYSEVLVGVVREVMDAFFNDPETQKQLKNAYAVAYSEEFTEKELKDMISFYRTETGKKTLKKMPIVMQKGRQKEIELAGQLNSPKYDQMLKEKVDKLRRDGVLPREF